MRDGSTADVDALGPEDAALVTTLRAQPVPAAPADWLEQGLAMIDRSLRRRPVHLTLGLSLAAASIERTPSVTEQRDGLAISLRGLSDGAIELELSTAEDAAGRLVVVSWLGRWADGMLTPWLSFVTPLAAVDGGSRVRYRLGASGDPDAYEVDAHWADHEELDAAVVRAAFDQAVPGIARRAWEEYLASSAGSVNGTVTDLARRLLQRRSR